MIPMCNSIGHTSGSTLASYVNGTKVDCMESRTYSVSITDDCGNTSTAHVVVTRLADTHAPTCPDLDDHDLNCIGEIPCVDDVLVLVEAGVTDNCPGHISVVLYNDTGSPVCENGSFSRTYSFTVTDECGNSTHCSVTYSGYCDDGGYCTLTQGGWGNAGGQYPWSDGDGQASTSDIITALMSVNGPVVIGNAGNTLTVQSAQCVITLLPSAGGPAPLASGAYTASPSNACDAGDNQQNPQGRLKNNLATNTIALQLNIWYSAYFGLDLGSVDLTSPCIVGIDLSWTALGYPATVQGLLDFANDVLGGAYTNNSLAGLAAGAISSINEYWDECQTNYEDPCDADKSGQDLLTENWIDEDSQMEVNHSVYPNPLSGAQAIISFNTIEAAHAIVDVYDLAGHRIGSLFNAAVDGNTEYKLEFDTSNHPAGIYIYRLQVNNDSKQSLHYGKIFLLK